MTQADVKGTAVFTERTERPESQGSCLSLNTRDLSDLPVLSVYRKSRKLHHAGLTLSARLLQERTETPGSPGSVLMNTRDLSDLPALSVYLSSRTPNTGSKS
jgi:hypothetical protein